MLSILKLALPILMGQVGHVLIGLGDSFIAAKHQTTTLAAVGVANGLTMPIFLFGIGILSVISSVVARKYRQADRKILIRTSGWLAVMLAGFFCGAIFVVAQFLEVLHLERELITPVKQYLEIIALSFFPAYVFHAIKELEQGHESVAFANGLLFFTVFLNVIVNSFLVLDWPGSPKLGIEGLALGSVIVRLLGCIVMMTKVGAFKIFGEINTTFLKETLKLGVPMGSMFFLEVISFCFIGVVAGSFGVIDAAANNIILNVASLTFVMPQSISYAVAVKVGAAIADRDSELIKKHIIASLFLAVAIALATTNIYLFFSENIAVLFTQNPEVVALCVSLFFVVAIFQLVDGIQITIAGIFRGFGDTKTTFAMVVLSYWLVGIPLGYLLAYRYEMGILGFWRGISVAIAIMAVGLLPLLKRSFNKVVQTI